jgi:hypothetical protein
VGAAGNECVLDFEGEFRFEFGVKDCFLNVGIVNAVNINR